ncbi:MAG: hypothetical protein M1837_000821 [Sclerophora amabilis]|nr:MAG: hypothetical protein M1837_000821 [Sclerophora amabilis]
MPVELRKRKAPAAPPPAAPPSKKKSSSVKSAVSKAKTAMAGKEDAPATNGTASANTIAVGNTISLDGFGGEVETHEGQKTTLKQLVDESSSGVVLFTYPKASTPGCTTQACLFRDSYTPLTTTGFSIYGLSTDSPTSNTTFKTKQNLPYRLLCDPSATLISAIGFKKASKGTTRGVFVVGKDGKILAAEPGGPGATVDAVRKLVGESAAPPAVIEAEKKAETDQAAADGLKDDEEKADVAADVADSAAKLDGNSKKEDPKL